ncbi:MAG: efflux RND transporter periplasmic adaptor subunit [Acidobacteria bacterium]|nr:efflux RND transporter periplasmic adaptor subunit [Acidobacteriota bacterium]
MIGILLALALFGAGMVVGVRLLGRAGNSAGENGAATATQEGQARYHCPMHPVMVSDQPGDCPICGMRLVPIEAESTARAESPPPPSTQAHPKKVIYRSTMHPNEVSDRPGLDSMGMEMERVEVEVGAPLAGNAVEGLAPVRIPYRKQQLIGVRTEPVERSPFIRNLRTVGRVTVDETRIHHVHTKIEGWVDHLMVNATGEKVRRGQPLLSIYSPELLATQEELLLALKARREMPETASPAAIRRADELVASSRRRLLLYDFPPAQVEELERTGEAMRAVTLYAPISGYILQRNVTQGEKITPESNLLDIADLSRVWVLASVYEYELPFVKAGQPATMSLSYQPGKSYPGKVVLIYPILEGSSRTVQVRLEFENPELELKPEMFTEVTINADLGERLAIPESAVLSTGTRNVVFVARDAGIFDPREVRLGLRLPDRVEVLEGLKEGETIVSSGNFLIDSESKLKAALEAASAPKTSTQTAPAGERR